MSKSTNELQLEPYVKKVSQNIQLLHISANIGIYKELCFDHLFYSATKPPGERV